MIGLENFTFTELLHAHSEAYGDEHVVYIADNERISCGELQRRVDTLAAILIDKYEIEPGDRVSLVGGNSVEWLVWFFAIVRAGAVVVVENHLLKAKEIRNHYQDFEVKHLVTGKVSEEMRRDLRNYFADKLISSEDVSPDKAYDDRRSELDELESGLPERREAINFFTSGSTSKPKVVMLSQEALVHNAFHLAEKSGFEAEAHLICVPLAHILGMVCGIRDIILGACFVLTENNLEMIVEACKEHRVSVLMNVPMVLKMLTTHPEFDNVVKPRIKYLVTGSAALTLEECEELENKYDAALVYGYGMTEAAGVITMPNFDAPAEKRYMSVGDPLKGIDLKIGKISDDSEAGEYCKAGEFGDVLVKSDTLMNGYVLDNDSEEVIDEKGYLHTGDIGFLDEEGYLHLCGRKKNIIIKGGEKILPDEIQSYLMELDSVKGAVVIGVPDDVYGEEIAALVVPHEGCDVSMEEVKTVIAKHCTRFKQPGYLLKYDKFPLTLVGKIDLAGLKKDALAKLGID